MRFTEAVGKTWGECKGSFKDTPWNMLALCFGASVLFSGAFFAIHDWGKVNPIISFFAGCITWMLAPAIAGLGLFGGLFATVVARYTFSSKQRFAVGPLTMLIWLIAGMLIAVPLFVLAAKLPVVGNQLKYLGHFMDD